MVPFFKFIFLHSVLFEERPAQLCVATAQGDLPYGSEAIHIIFYPTDASFTPQRQNIQGQETLSKKQTKMKATKS